jgi:predicted component of type VI protein secretion system
MSENAFSLIVCLPGEEPARHDLAGDSVTFGRSPENQIQMLVAEVSVRHGRLDRDGDVYRIVDPGSTNGTRLNGAPVGPEGVPLKPMDRLVIGTVVNAYFVPAAILASTSPADLVASLEASKAPATPKTAPVAVSAAPATPAAPAAPGAPAAPVRPGVPAAPGAPARAASPVGGPPAPPTSPGGATVKLDQVRGPGVKPAAIPAPPRPPATGVPAAPATPAAPGAAPVRPAGVVPVKPPGAVPVRPPGAPGAAPAPGGVQPIPLKRPAPSSPTIPLPKSPPKPGQ